MSNCSQCEHGIYWHESRREDQPHLFTLGPCLCGCVYMQPVSWTA